MSFVLTQRISLQKAAGIYAMFPRICNYYLTSYIRVKYGQIVLVSFKDISRFVNFISYLVCVSK